MVSPPWWIDEGTLAPVGLSECNHIQQQHASNRPEIDPEGEEEVLNAGPLGAVRAERPSVSPSHGEMQQGSAWVYTGWHHDGGEVLRGATLQTTGGPIGAFAATLLIHHLVYFRICLLTLACCNYLYTKSQPTTRQRRITHPDISGGHMLCLNVSRPSHYQS